jgi:phosphoesterase RecJ-like protein
MERGADRAAILEQMPSIESVATARVWGKLLQNIQTVREHQNIAYTIVDASMIDPDTSISLIGISSFIRDMGGVDIAILFLQESPDEIRVEFRSKGQYDVSKIAESLGGGGHRGAAGCRYRGMSINQAVERTIQAVEQAVRG